MYILQFKVLFNLILILQLTFRPFSLNCEFVSYDSDLHVLFLLRIVNIYLEISLSNAEFTPHNLYMGLYKFFRYKFASHKSALFLRIVSSDLAIEIFFLNSKFCFCFILKLKQLLSTQLFFLRAANVCLTIANYKINYKFKAYNLGVFPYNFEFTSSSSNFLVS